LLSYVLPKEIVSSFDLVDLQETEGTLSSFLNTDFYSAVEQTEEEFDAGKLTSDTWVISSQKDSQLLERLKNENVTLEKFINGQSYRGVLTGLTEAFLIDEETKKQLLDEDNKAVEIIKPVIRGRDILPWSNGAIESYLIGTFPSLNIDIENYISIKNHLLSFGKERLEQSGNQGSRKKTNNKWFETQDAIGYYQEFAKPKIMYQKFQVKPCFIYDEDGLYCNDSMWIIPTESKALLAILNSKMGWWLISKYCTQIQNGYQLIWKYFGQIPVPKMLTAELETLADETLALSSELQTKRQRFLKRLSDNFNGVKITGTIERFDELEFKQFLAELKKQKITLSLKQQDEWEEYFNEYKTECSNLVNQINTTDKEIDGMVYGLYGLTEEEIEIVET
jgi:small nuclear ribonucleoprotein (snRNP)-like protein